LEFYGTKGSLGISRRGFRILPDAIVPPEETIPQFTSERVNRDPEALLAGRTLRTERVEDRSGDQREQFREHVRNFLDCVKSRATPISDLTSGHRVATACHLANISLRLGRKLSWDATQETIVNDAEAAKMLVREYRTPWDRELKALVG
jgi:hypothetical protein